MLNIMNLMLQHKSHKLNHNLCRFHQCYLHSIWWDNRHNHSRKDIIHRLHHCHHLYRWYIRKSLCKQHIVSYNYHKYGCLCLRILHHCKRKHKCFNRDNLGHKNHNNHQFRSYMCYKIHHNCHKYMQKIPSMIQQHKFRHKCFLLSIMGIHNLNSQ